MIIKSKRRELGHNEGWYHPIEADTLDPVYSVVYFYIYPAVLAGFQSFRDAERWADESALREPVGVFSVIQTGDED